jgi:hypothetical protein
MEVLLIHISFTVPHFFTHISRFKGGLDARASLVLEDYHCSMAIDGIIIDHFDGGEAVIVSDLRVVCCTGTRDSMTIPAVGVGITITEHVGNVLSTDPRCHPVVKPFASEVVQI